MFCLKKKITHDHILYIINKVSLPYIEYLSIFFISPNQSNQFNQIIRSVFLLYDRILHYVI